ncbi:MAG: BrnA antitoxin family protein [Treponema sp.]|jgi:uncharacterized protein (DUF4415 family)|nr:BrnA antitoxin family protein [Treponema sp.]
MVSGQNGIISLKKRQVSPVRGGESIDNMTFDEVKKLPTLSDERVAEIMAFKNTDFSDCPIQTVEELVQCKRTYPQAQAKTQAVFVDADIIEWFKKQGGDYQVLINNALWRMMEGAGCSLPALLSSVSHSS